MQLARASLVLGAVETLKVTQRFKAGIKTPELGPYRPGLESEACSPTGCKFVISFLSPLGF